MSDSSESSGSFGDNGVVQLTGNIILVAFIVLFFIIVAVFCHNLYAKWFWSRSRQNAAATPPRRHLVPATGGGLDPSLLKTIPVIVFDPQEFKDGLECAVCLSEVSEGENTRLLPKCNHGFHLNCIDMWFESHSTCPLCRNPIANQNQANPVSESSSETIIQTPTVENSTEAPNFPTNVLFLGNETQVTTIGPRVEKDHQGTAAESSSSSSIAETSNRHDGISVISIPGQINEDEEQKSPVLTRFKSLKRLLSGNRWFNPSSPRNLDLEQGVSSQN